MLKPCDGLGLGTKSFAKFRVRGRSPAQHLQGHDATQFPMPGLVDHAHPTGTNQGKNLVTANAWVVQFGEQCRRAVTETAGGQG